MFRPIRLASLLAACLCLAPAAQAADKVSFGLDWVAEPEYGGYYQALATGIYKKYGLDVSIVQGGPQVNNAQLLIAGRLTFDITSNAFLALNFAQENIPFVAIAAGFQKDPDALIAHPGRGNDSFADLKGKPIAVSVDTRASWWLYPESEIRLHRRPAAPLQLQPGAVLHQHGRHPGGLCHQRAISGA